MQKTEVLFVGFGKLNQLVAQQFTASGTDWLAMRRSPAPKVLVQDASQIWQTPIRAKLVVVAISADELTPQGYRDSYLAVANQLAQALSTGVLVADNILWVSSTRVIGGLSGEISDEAPAQPSDEQGDVLAQCEQVLHGSQATVCIARLTGIYGPTRQWMLRQWQQNKLYGDATLTNRIHIDDAARALTFLGCRLMSGLPVPKQVLVTDLESVSRHEIARWLDTVHGKSPKAPITGKGRVMRPEFLKSLGFEWRYPSFRYGYLQWLAK